MKRLPRLPSITKCEAREATVEEAPHIVAAWEALLESLVRAQLLKHVALKPENEARTTPPKK